MAQRAKVTEFELVPGVDSLAIFRKGNSWMSSIALTNGRSCLVSPLAGVNNVRMPFGQISHLLAPNHYHNKGLVGSIERCPKVSVCASRTSKPRLEKITNLKIKPLGLLEKYLPDSFNLLEPVGLKTGEVWLRFAVGKRFGWLVTDAFCGQKMNASVTTTNEPEILKTFPSYGIQDRAVYKDWVLAQIKKDKPCLIIPCHGAVVRDTSLPAKLTKLVNKKI